jgi:hypothetical protein
VTGTGLYFGQKASAGAIGAGRVVDILSPGPNVWGGGTLGNGYGKSGYYVGGSAAFSFWTVSGTATLSLDANFARYWLLASVAILESSWSVPIIQFPMNPASGNAVENDWNAKQRVIAIIASNTVPSVTGGLAYKFGYGFTPFGLNPGSGWTAGGYKFGVTCIPNGLQAQWVLIYQDNSNTIYASVPLDSSVNALLPTAFEWRFRNAVSPATYATLEVYMNGTLVDTRTWQPAQPNSLATFPPITSGNGGSFNAFCNSAQTGAAGGQNLMRYYLTRYIAGPDDDSV